MHHNEHTDDSRAEQTHTCEDAIETETEGTTSKVADNAHPVTRRTTLTGIASVGLGLSTLGLSAGRASAKTTSTQTKQNIEVTALPHEGPLQGYARNIGGSAGEGTHGGTSVERPAEMPTRDDADYVVSTVDGLINAVTTDEAIVYIYRRSR